MPDENPGLMTIFGEALEIAEPASRKAYLDRVCGEDVDLRRRVEALLSAHASAGHFLEPDASSKLEAVTVAAPLATGAFSSDAGQSDEMATGDHLPAGATATFEGTRSVGPTTGPAAGTVIAGRYTLLEVIGEGGMGTVYRASQSEPVKRLVALKLIKVGMDSKAVLARFDAERQALALMDHSNIARVYDGGTTSSGQPFFAMEFVNGKPITEYCDSVRLPVRSRLELFVAVCQAVQHAHQKGIIHRDLKPGNVLVAEVDGRPTPKVIDFGVAKATEQKLTDMSFADTGAIVGTPQYMSPEQADPTSMDIDTRTDVYALGVILYELLVGSPPVDAKQFKRGAILEMMRMVREVDPPRPSTRLSTSEALPNIAANRNLEPAQLKRALRGDLDWIVMKALEKDRTRRYDTANGFAADVLRHLAYEPVLAAPPGKVYRLRKFVRKNRGAVMAASLVFSMLLLGIVGTTWGLIRAEKAREEEAKRVQERDEAIGRRDAAIDVANARAEELKYRLGVSDMVLASAAYEKSNVYLAAERLKLVPPEQRGWEWHYLHRLTHGGLFTLYGHLGGVLCAAFSLDGTRIATCSTDSTVRIWDARTGVPLRTLQGYTGMVYSLCFSPDGTHVVTSGATERVKLGEQRPGEVKVWDVRTGKVVLELKGRSSQVAHVAYSPDGRYLATGEDNGILAVWDADTGSLAFSVLADEKGGCCLAFSPDGTRIVTGGKGHGLKIWDAATGIIRTKIKNIELVRDVAFSPDGKRIAFASEAESAKILDAATGRELVVLEGHTNGVDCLSFSPDGSRIVTGNNNETAKVWDVVTGRLLVNLKGHQLGMQLVGVSAASFSPDGTRILTASLDGTAKLWDARSGGVWTELVKHSDQLERVAFNLDATRLLVASRDKFARVWEVQTGRILLELKNVVEVAISPDWTQVAGKQDGTVKIWDAGTGACLHELKGLTDPKGVSFSLDSTKVVSCSVCETGTPYGGQTMARVWDVRTGAMLAEIKNQDSFDRAYFSPDGTKIVTVGEKAIVIDIRTGASLLEIDAHSGVGGLFARFSPDGRQIVTGSWDRSLLLWDASTGKRLAEFKGHGSFVNSVAFSPDGKRIATGSYDQSIRVWDVRTGASLIELRGHTAAVLDVDFSPDGTLLASASADGTVRLWHWGPRNEAVELECVFWNGQASFSPDGSKVVATDDNVVKVCDTRTGALLTELRGLAGVFPNASFSPDGTRIVTGSWDTTARIWDARTGASLVELKGHTRFVSDAEFSPDGSRVATTSGDKTARIWDARTGTELVRITHGEELITRVWFSSDGAQIVTASVNQTKVWDARTGELRNGVAVPLYRRPGLVSPDGRFLAYSDVLSSRIVKLHPTSDEIAERLNHSRPDARRYLAGFEVAKRNSDRHALRFYVDRLLSLPSERTTARLKERNDLQPDSRLIARSSFHHPALANEPYDRNAIQILAIKGDRLAQRLVAQEFLRNGKPGPAIPMLFTCLVSRPVSEPPAPPVEELLLAQAYLALKQPEEAKRFYRAAVEWLDRPLRPIRAANIVSHCALNPWAGIVASVAPVEDLRRNPFDWESWHECDVFQAQVEKELATP